MEDKRPTLLVVGAGMGGLVAAVRAAQLGMAVVLLEKSERVGGTASFSGGQVWVGGNHIEAREGIDDSLDETLTYVRTIAARKGGAGGIDPELAERWVLTAARAAEHYEKSGVIRWEIIDGYPDYYFPEQPSGRRTGRYLTGGLFDGASLGSWRPALQLSPYFLIGVTYPELFSWGGVSSRTSWDWDLIARRREEDKISFGPAVTAPFFKAAIDLGVDIRLGHAVKALRTKPDEGGEKVIGLSIDGPEGAYELDGTVLLATGAHDWSEQHSDRFMRLAWEDSGSIAPPYLTGDGLDMAEEIGAEVRAIPPWAAPVLPGYQVDEPPVYPGDKGFRNLLESGLPHTFMVNAQGERFCDDSFHSDIIYAAFREQDGQRPNLPIYMIWDSNHHRKYGLGTTKPGEAYPNGLVTQADTLEELGEKLGIDPAGLAHTAEVFNGPAREGRDPAFDRGNNLSVQVFRGDANHKPHGNVGPVEAAPFYGMRLRLLGTGIAAGGIAVDRDARALRPDGTVIEGLYAVGECAARDTAGVGYNSGYSLSRAMAFGTLAAEHAAAAADIVFAQEDAA